MKKPQKWIPEFCYEEEADGVTSSIPFVSVPPDETMPSVVYVFESRQTGEFEPGLNGDEVPIVEMTLHQYADMHVLKERLTTEVFDIVRNALGLEPLRDATQKGKAITDRVRQNVDIISSARSKTK